MTDRRAEHRAYSKTPAGQARRKRYEASDKGRERKRRYNHTLRGRLRAVADIENRRAKRHGAEGVVTTDEWQAVLEGAGWRCHWCGRPMNGTASMEHVTPISRGGAHRIDNIVAACMPCNRERGAGRGHHHNDAGEPF